MAFAKFVFTQPRFTAVLFISSTKEDTEPLTCSASAVATSFAEGSKRPYRPVSYTHLDAASLRMLQKMDAI